MHMANVGSVADHLESIADHASNFITDDLVDSLLIFYLHDRPELVRLETRSVYHAHGVTRCRV